MPLANYNYLGRLCYEVSIMFVHHRPQTKERYVSRKCFIEPAKRKSFDLRAEIMRYVNGLSEWDECVMLFRTKSHYFFIK